MHSVFHRRFKKIEDERNNILEICKSLSQGKIYYNPHGSKWSAVQILQHLIKTEQATVLMLRRKLAQQNFETENLSSLLRGVLLALSLYSTFKYKAPKSFEDFPNEGTIDKLGEDWNKVRESFRDLLNTLDKSFLNKIIFNHPRAGWISLRFTFAFIHAHMKHHERQLKRFKD